MPNRWANPIKMRSETPARLASLSLVSCSAPTPTSWGGPSSLFGAPPAWACQRPPPLIPPHTCQGNKPEFAASASALPLPPRLRQGPSSRMFRAAASASARTCRRFSLPTAPLQLSEHGIFHRQCLAPPPKSRPGAPAPPPTARHRFIKTLARYPSWQMHRAAAKTSAGAPAPPQLLRHRFENLGTVPFIVNVPRRRQCLGQNLPALFLCQLFRHRYQKPWHGPFIHQCAALQPKPRAISADSSVNCSTIPTTILGTFLFIVDIPRRRQRLRPKSAGSPPTAPPPLSEPWHGPLLGQRLARRQDFGQSAGSSADCSATAIRTLARLPAWPIASRRRQCLSQNLPALFPLPTAPPSLSRTLARSPSWPTPRAAAKASAKTCRRSSFANCSATAIRTSARRLSSPMSRAAAKASARTCRRSSFANCFAYHYQNLGTVPSPCDTAKLRLGAPAPPPIVLQPLQDSDPTCHTPPTVFFLIHLATFSVLLPDLP